MGTMHWNVLFAIFFLLFAFGLSEVNEEEKKKYCEVYSEHLLCKYPVYDTWNCQEYKEVAPDAKQQKIIVDWHNEKRQKVALGKENRGNPGPQPPAANMMEMQWDPELAKIAQRWANQCSYGHSCNKCNRVNGGRFAVGQSISLRGTSDQVTFDFVEAMTPWYEAEVGKVNKDMVDSYVKNWDWGHYSQVVWWNSRSVGCGAASYLSVNNPGWFDFFVVCDYGAAANLEGVKMYQKGPACSNCPKDTKCSSTYNGLCAITKTPFDVTDAFNNTDQVYLGLESYRHIEI